MDSRRALACSIAMIALSTSLLLQAVAAVEESSSAVKCYPYAYPDTTENGTAENGTDSGSDMPVYDCCYYSYSCCSYDYSCCYPYYYAAAELAADGSSNETVDNGTDTAIAIYLCYCLDVATTEASSAAATSETNDTSADRPVPVDNCCYYTPCCYDYYYAYYYGCCYYYPCCYDVVVDTGEGATDQPSGDAVDGGPAPEPQTVTNDTEPEPQPPVDYPYYCCGCYCPQPAAETDGTASADGGDSASLIYCPLEEASSAGAPAA